jgi:hypothetical protein
MENPPAKPPIKRVAGGKFQKGHSGNPGGRAKSPVRLKELYDKHDCDDKIFARLMELLYDTDGKVAIAALDRLLDRRYGKVPVVDEDGEIVRDTRIELVIPDLNEIEHNPEPH